VTPTTQGSASSPHTASRDGALLAALEAQRPHWFVLLPVFLGSGIGLYFSLAWEPWLIAATLPVVLALIAWRSTRGLAAVVMGLLLIAATGFALAKIRTEWVRAPFLQKRIGPVEVKGYVSLVEPRVTRGQRLTLLVTHIAGLADNERPRRVRIRAMKPLAGLKPGDAVVVRATLAPPSAPALPAGYDFARTAWYLGLGGVGYSLTAPSFDETAPPAPFRLRVWAPVERLRQAIGSRIVTALPGEAGAIANALITGERGGISEATNDAYRDAGLFHILSISGLHMVIMAGTVFLVVRLMLAAIPRLALRYPIKKWAAVAAALAALGYLLISGAAFATVRSYIMISIMFLAVLLDRPALAMRNVALAALVILLIYPESLLDVGFQMSFAAVTALVAAYEYIAARPRRRPSVWRGGAFGRAAVFLGGIVLSTIVAGVAVAPFAAYHFHTSQQFAVLANIAAVPICNLLVMPAALLAMISMPAGLEGPALALMGFGIDAMTACARWAAALPGAVGHVRAMPLSAFLLMVAGGLWFLLWPTRWRTLGVVAAGGGLALAPLLPRPDILVGRDGALVAVRNAPGDRYWALAARGSNFELKRWLEHDGDPREIRAATYDSKSTAPIRCDGIGCGTQVRARTVAVSRHPAALRDDCERAHILLLDIPRPQGCPQPGTVIDVFALRRLGTHALYIEDDGGVRVETVAQHRGDRPWSRLPPLPHPRVVARPPADIGAPAPAADPGNLRPEAEGDDDPRFEQD
jgi:competence protein ComEC